MTVASAVTARSSALKATVSGYVALTKPRIIELLLVTTLPAMVLAARGMPSPEVAVATLVGGAAAAGSANALNCYIDRDIDAVMRRTAHRPLIDATISPRAALIFGSALALASVAILWVATNPLAVLLTVAAIAGYVVGYTLLLKRRTPQNIVWGGAAGCMPTLIGWAAVTGRLAWPPVVLFLIVFFWTPPHFWALAMRFRNDYAAAGVPMLPVVATDRVVVSRITLYAWLTVATSLLLWPVASMGPIYVVAAVVLGAVLMQEVYRLRQQVTRGGRIQPLRLFHISITYLSLLFIFVAVDVVVRPWF